ncbi:DUF1566 domain-containing protein [Aeromonas veronii]|uniref:Lcl C-terminal domain-containing protein n=1 Tax=Aeromonas veronii TaxID=654 RepID=UPI0030045AA0
MKLFLLLLWLPASMALAACDLSDRLTRQGEVIHDRLNQLEWQACSLGSQWLEGKGCVGTPALLTLLEAKDEAARLGEGWRLPTIEELFTLLDEDCRAPMTDPNFFPDIHDNGENAAPYWTSSTIEEMPELVYYIDFMHGLIDGHTDRFAQAARLVRSRP